MSVPVTHGRRFGFADLHALTPALPGHLRAAVFDALPDELQREAWDSLAEWAEAWADRTWELLRDDGVVGDGS